MTNELKWGHMKEFKIDTFQTVLIDELIPYVDAHFRTIANRHTVQWQAFQWVAWKHIP